jgi:hypothetical protein
MSFSVSGAYRTVGWISLAALAVVAARVSTIANDHGDCSDSRAASTLLLVLGIAAVVAALRIAGARLRWAIFAAALYGAGVVLTAAHAIGACTALAG